MAKNKHIPVWQRLLLITAWFVMALVLAVLALVICITRTLQPEQLTRIANKMANEYLDARVEIGKVALSAGGNHFLCIDVDDLTIISEPMLRMDAERRDSLPDCLDTLLTIKHFDGGISLADIIVGDITLSDIALGVPGVSRIHGGGFGGSIQAYVPTEISKLFATSVEQLLGPDTVHFIELSSKGAFAQGVG